MNGPPAIPGTRQTRPPAAARDIVAAMGRDGWTFEGIGGDSHLRFSHPSGVTTSGPSTPSGNPATAVRATVARARRVLREAGVAPDRRPSGRRGNRPSRAHRAARGRSSAPTNGAPHSVQRDPWAVLAALLEEN